MGYLDRADLVRPLSHRLFDDRAGVVDDEKHSLGRSAQGLGAEVVVFWRLVLHPEHGLADCQPSHQFSISFETEDLTAPNASRYKAIASRPRRTDNCTWTPTHCSLCLTVSFPAVDSPPDPRCSQRAFRASGYPARP